MVERPLILFTNDDGIESPGLWAVVEAFSNLGELLVAAPCEQQSGTGRSMPSSKTGRIHAWDCPLDLPDCHAFCVDGTPAQAVQFAVLELADRKPSLVVSGINYGDNTGNVVTISGTIGAAIEATSLGIPALAVSQQTRHGLHSSYSTEVDFRIASRVARYFGQRLIEPFQMPADVDFLKIDLPLGVTEKTAWRFTRLSRHRVYWPLRPERKDRSDEARLKYAQQFDPAEAEPESDVYAVLFEGLVAITPISLDFSSRTDLPALQRSLCIDPCF